MGRKFKTRGKHVLDTAEIARAKYLDARRIKGSRYVVTDKVLEVDAKAPNAEPKK